MPAASAPASTQPNLKRLWRRLPPLATDRILAGHVQLDHDAEDTFDRFATQR
jgi:hypothetical protein